jgi:murein DD-endopeptidase MepM/ murein hydrolase activator NlpD
MPAGPAGPAVASLVAAPADPASAALVAPVATDATTANALAMLGFARLAGAFELPFVPGLGEPIARAQVVMRDFFHGLEDQMSDLVDDSGLGVHDLTMLTVEPVAHTESSGFGWRDDPIRHTRRFHSGTDFRGKPGTPVVAAGDGVVTFSGRMGGYGNMVEIDHGNGLATRYGHMSEVLVEEGQDVEPGAVLGRIGSTGRSTGPHLHYEVRVDGEPVDPTRFLRAGSGLLAAE